jgi:hypothetical protein
MTARVTPSSIARVLYRVVSVFPGSVFAVQAPTAGNMSVDVGAPVQLPSENSLYDAAASTGERADSTTKGTMRRDFMTMVLVLTSFYQVEEGSFKVEQKSVG